MIRTPTTFIVGAGASCPYGLPAGKELLKQARELKAEDEVFQLLISGGVKVDNLLAFIADIKNTPVRSIDSHLEKRQQRPQIVETGKTVIAGLMGKAIHDAVRPTGEDWIAEVFERMHRGAPDWDAFSRHNSAVRFVTFNFDYIIEDRLSLLLKNTYEGVTDEQIAETLPVIHVHGLLSRVPPRSLTTEPFHEFQREWLAWLKAAGAEVRVAHESVPSEWTAQACEAVRRSHVLCFLGFGYDPQNLERLNLPAALGVTPPNSIAVREVYGSAWGLSPGEQSEVLAGLQGHVTKLGKDEEDCRDVVLNYHVLKG